MPYTVPLIADSIRESLRAPDISVVICTFNRYDLLADAIASIERQDLAAERYELLVVDNSDDLAARERFFGGFAITCNHRVITEPRPGLSRARNIGVMAATGELVAFIDDDAVAAPDWLRQIVQTFADYEHAAVVGGPVRPVWCGERPAWLHQWLEGYLTILDRGAETRILGDDEWLVGTNIAFRAEAIKEAGMFAENIGRIKHLLLSNEEMSISRAIRERGHQIVYNPAIVTDHRVHADRANQAWLRRRVFWQVISDMFSAQNRDGAGIDRDIDNVFEFLGQLTPKHRGIMGLFLDTDDPELFHAQTTAIAALTRLLATDGADWRRYLRRDAE